MARVLIADDDDTIRTLLCKLLTRNNFEVDEASDGAIALDMLKQRPYDAMLLDLMMPRKNGFDVVAELRETAPEFLSHVLIVSAFPDRAYSSLGNVCRIVPKPFEIHKLLAALDECAAAHQPAAN